MADTANTDVLVYVVSEKAGTVPAESMSALVDGDKLTSDFLAGKFFEAENFTFGIKLEDNEGKDEKKKPKKKTKLDARGRPVDEPDDDEDDAKSRPYERWRSITDDVAQPDAGFRAEPEDFSLLRSIDASSPILLQHCLDVQKFSKVVVVKRSRAAYSGALAGFLRFEFEKVYIKSIDWTDGDAVKENCKFKFASVKVTYVKRKPDGSAASSWPCKWEQPING